MCRRNSLSDFSFAFIFERYFHQVQNSRWESFTLFFFHHFKCAIQGSSSFYSFTEKNQPSVIFLHPKGQWTFFFFGYFSDFLFLSPLVLSSLSLMSLGVILFMFTLSGTCWASGICGLTSFYQFQKIFGHPFRIQLPSDSLLY